MLSDEEHRRWLERAWEEQALPPWNGSPEDRPTKTMLRAGAEGIAALTGGSWFTLTDTASLCFERMLASKEH